MAILTNGTSLFLSADLLVVVVVVVVVVEVFVHFFDPFFHFPFFIPLPACSSSLFEPIDGMISDFSDS